MKDVEQLIQKFWAGTISGEETRLLMELLDAPAQENAGLSREEFFRIRELATVTLRPEQSARVLDRLRGNMDALQQGTDASPGTAGGTARPGLLRRMVVWGRSGVGRAAVLLLLGGTCWLGKMALMHKPSSIASKAIQRHAIFLKEIVNRSDTSETIRLQDGSIVVLQARSGISYYAPFGDSTRDISVAGKALFTAAHRVGKPFTVYADGIATTALGTTFSVDLLTPERITVRLYEGRVVVSKAARLGTSGGDHIFLKPGQELSYDRLTQRSLVRNILPSVPSGITGRLSHAHSNGIAATDGAELKFENELLATVFQRLNKQYGIDILFDKVNLEGLYFTGTVYKGDSLFIILSAICNSNQLTYSILNGSIRINK